MEFLETRATTYFKVKLQDNSQLPSELNLVYTTANNPCQMGPGQYSTEGIIICVNAGKEYSTVHGMEKVTLTKNWQ